MTIPEGARLLALADAFDVMTESRPYAAAKSLPEALQECLVNDGAQFAPDAVEALVTLAHETELSPH